MDLFVHLWYDAIGKLEGLQDIKHTLNWSQSFLQLVRPSHIQFLRISSSIWLKMIAAKMEYNVLMVVILHLDYFGMMTQTQVVWSLLWLYWYKLVWVVLGSSLEAKQHWMIMWHQYLIDSLISMNTISNASVPHLFLQSRYIMITPNNRCSNFYSLSYVNLQQQPFDPNTS